MIRNPDTTIIVDYYQGSYGPTLRIDLHSLHELNRIKKVVSNLKEGKISEFQFGSWANVEITGLNNLILRVEPIKRNYYQNILIQQSPIGMVFVWVETEDNWGSIEGLIDGLIESDCPGHQYLTKEGDKVLIEMAYKE